MKVFYREDNFLFLEIKTSSWSVFRQHFIFKGVTFWNWVLANLKRKRKYFVYILTTRHLPVPLTRIVQLYTKLESASQYVVFLTADIWFIEGMYLWWMKAKHLNIFNTILFPFFRQSRERNHLQSVDWDIKHHCYRNQYNIIRFLIHSEFINNYWYHAMFAKNVIFFIKRYLMINCVWRFSFLCWYLIIQEAMIQETNSLTKMYTDACIVIQNESK